MEAQERVTTAAARFHAIWRAMNDCQQRIAAESILERGLVEVQHEWPQAAAEYGGRH